MVRCLIGDGHVDRVEGKCKGVYFDLYLANNGPPSRLAQLGIKNKIVFKCKSVTLRKKIRVTSNLLVENMTQ